MGHQWKRLHIPARAALISVRMRAQDDGVGEGESEEEGTAGDGSASLGSDSDADAAADEEDDEDEEAVQRRLNIRTSACACPSARPVVCARLHAAHGDEGAAAQSVRACCGLDEGRETHCLGSPVKYHCCAFAEEHTWSLCCRPCLSRAITVSLLSRCHALLFQYCL